MNARTECPYCGAHHDHEDAHPAPTTVLQPSLHSEWTRDLLEEIGSYVDTSDLVRDLEEHGGVDYDDASLERDALDRLTEAGYYYVYDDDTFLVVKGGT